MQMKFLSLIVDWIFHSSSKIPSSVVLIRVRIEQRFLLACLASSSRRFVRYWCGLDGSWNWLLGHRRGGLGAWSWELEIFLIFFVGIVHEGHLWFACLAWDWTSLLLRSDLSRRLLRGRLGGLSWLLSARRSVVYSIWITAASFIITVFELALGFRLRLPGACSRSERIHSSRLRLWYWLGNWCLNNYKYCQK